MIVCWEGEQGDEPRIALITGLRPSNPKDSIRLQRIVPFPMFLPA